MKCERRVGLRFGGRVHLVPPPSFLPPPRHGVASAAYGAAYDAARWAVSTEDEDAAVNAAVRAQQQQRRCVWCVWWWGGGGG